MDRLPDDLKEWQDALDDRDNAKHAYESYTGNDMRAAARLCEVYLGASHRVERLRKEHHEGQRIKFALDFADSRESIWDEMAEDFEHNRNKVYSEDEYFDNRERARSIR